MSILSKPLFPTRGILFSSYLYIKEHIFQFSASLGLGSWKRTLVGYWCHYLPDIISITYIFYVSVNEILPCPVISSFLCIFTAFVITRGLMRITCYSYEHIKIVFICMKNKVIEKIAPSKWSCVRIFMAKSQTSMKLISRHGKPLYRIDSRISVPFIDSQITCGVIFLMCISETKKLTCESEIEG